jgi:PAS domain S-box-containing protein
MEEKNRINKFIEVIMKVARGDYSAQIELSGKNDDLDSLAMGINMMTDDIRYEITEHKKAEEELKVMNQRLKETSEELRALNEEFEAANEELKSTNEELQNREHELRERTHDLGERIKELSCLYGIDEASRREGITIEEVLRETVQLIPPSWQYPEITGCRISFRDKKYRTGNFKKTRWMQQADIIVNNKKAGWVEVCYLKRKPEEDEGPFVKEERELINSIAERLGRFITRKEAEEALRSSEERFKILFEYAPDGYYLNDLKGLFVDGNKAAEELTGYKRDELIGKSFLKLKLLSPKEIPKAASLLAKNALGKSTGPDEFTLNQKGGTQVVVEIRTFPLKIKDQSLVLANVRDITKRKKAEAAVRESEEKYRTLVESATDYIFMIGEDNRVLSLNKAGAFLFRKPPEKIIGKSIFELFPKEIATRYSDSLKKAYKTGQSSSYESRMVVEGKESWLSVSLNPVRDRTGKVVSVMGVCRDITAHKQADEQIKASLGEKEVLLKEIHHRVKNNMQIIASLLRIQAADIKDEEIQDMFNEIHDRIRSMSVLYEMLYQSKDMTRVDLSEYIRRLTTHLVSMYRSGLGPISLKLDVKNVHLDVKRAIPCGLIITELVSNTLKHAFLNGRKGKIAVVMHPNKGKRYTLIVSDNGIGFPEELDFRKTKSLGMKLVVDLVKQIGGTIDLSKEKGTEFKIVF